MKLSDLHPVESCIRDSARYHVCYEMGDSGTIRSWDGELSRFGLTPPVLGEGMMEHLGLALDLLPTGDTKLILPGYRLPNGHEADLYILQAGFMRVWLTDPEVRQETRQVDAPKSKSGDPPEGESDADIIIFQYVGSSDFRLFALPPRWISSFPEALQSRRDLVQRFPLLEDFLDRAEQFWSWSCGGRLVSSTWIETLEGENFAMEAVASRFGGKSWMFLRSAGDNYLEKQHLIQKGREGRLVNERLERIQRRLLESEARVRTILGNVPALIWTTDVSSSINFLEGSGWRHMDDKNSSEEPRRAFWNWVSQDAVAMSAHELALQAMPTSFELTVRDRIFQAHVEPMSDSAGRVVGTIGIALDITVRKQQEEELETLNKTLEKRVESRTLELQENLDRLETEIQQRLLIESSLAQEKEQLSVTLRSIGDAVITTNDKQRVELINSVAESLTGWTAESAIGRHLSEVFITETRTRGAEEILTLNSRQGVQFRIACTASPIQLDNGGTPGQVIVFRDVTLENKLREQIVNAGKLEAIGVLAGGIAHDFNNLLMAISGNLDLLIHARSTEDFSEYLTEAQDACMSAKGLTSQLLTFAKGGFPRLEVQDLEPALRDALNLTLRNTPIELVFSSSSDLCAVELDSDQFRHAIQAVVLNAIDAMPSGGTLNVSMENLMVTELDQRAIARGTYVCIQLEDSGVGIPFEALSRVFEPYFTTKPTSTGLGLASAYSIIQQHGGHMSIESVVNRGTTVTLLLPASDHPGDMRTSKQDDTTRGSGKVLIMDDDAQVRKVLDRMIQRCGYSTFLTTKGEEAIEAYRRAYAGNDPFDAVVLDLTVPGGLGGRETMMELLSIDPDVKGIVSSGYSEANEMAQFEKFGFTAAIAKPYQLNALSRTLHDTILA